MASRLMSITSRLMSIISRLMSIISRLMKRSKSQKKKQKWGGGGLPDVSVIYIYVLRLFMRCFLLFLTAAGATAAFFSTLAAFFSWTQQILQVRKNTGGGEGGGLPCVAGYSSSSVSPCGVSSSFSLLPVLPPLLFPALPLFFPRHHTYCKSTYEEE